MKNNKSIRNIILKYVENNGPQNWTTLHHIVLTIAGKPLNCNNYGVCYVDNVSLGVTAFLPTTKDARYLKKDTDGLYHLAGI